MQVPNDQEIEQHLAALQQRMPSSDKEAEERFNKFQRYDPFPTIAPALLNSADFCDYIATTGMLHPFNATRKDLKLASYALRLKGKVVYWDEKDEYQEKNIQKKGDTFTLKRDMIAFVTLEPYLRLPDYIALRFNLKISNVYRGLLLGTGPIVDPGFQGYLSIPLHNLTTNDYVLEAEERLIWVEFTKLGHHDVWSSKATVRSISRHPEIYLPFSGPVGKDQDVMRYISDASPGRPVQSSLPEAVHDAQASARLAEDKATVATNKVEDAKNKVEDVKRNIDRALIVAVAAVVVTVALSVALSLYSVYSLVQEASSYLRDSASKVETQNAATTQVQQSNANLQRSITDLKHRLDQQTRQLNLDERTLRSKGILK